MKFRRLRGSYYIALEVYRPVVADSHHFDEEQDPDPHYNEKKWTRILL
jgi:hypothetical protein